MFKGIKRDGKEILPSYTDLTVFIKEQKGQPTDRVTLYDTGDFFRGITTKVVGPNIVTDSYDSKSEKLQKKYGKKIFGLSKPYRLEYIREFLRPEFMKNVRFQLML